MKKRELKNLLSSLPAVKPSEDLDRRVFSSIDRLEHLADVPRKSIVTQYRWQLSLAASVFSVALLLLFIIPDHKNKGVYKYYKDEMNTEVSALFDCSDQSQDLFSTEIKSIKQVLLEKSSPDNTEGGLL